jgi:hypothetical protein
LIILPNLLYNLVVLYFLNRSQFPFDIARVLIDYLFTYISTILKLSAGGILYIILSLCIKPFRWSLHFVLVHELWCTSYEFWQLSIVLDRLPWFLKTLKFLMLQLKVTLEVIGELMWFRFSFFAILVKRGLNDIFFDDLGGSSCQLLHYL